MKSVVFFDVDGTLIKGNINSMIIWELYKMRLASGVLLLRAGFWYVLWKVGAYSDLHVIAKKGARELAGISREKMNTALDAIFKKRIHKKIYREGVECIKEHQKNGHDVILLSSSFEPFVERVGIFLGLSEVIATRLRTREGVYTGDIDGDVVGGNKHKIVEAWRARRNPTAIYAYTDQYQDVPLLEIVSNPIAVNPDFRLRTFAKRRRWPILRFSEVLNR